MKFRVGIKKELDALGRLVIPKEIRERFKLTDEVELIITTEGVLLRNPRYELSEINGKDSRIKTEN